MYDYVSEETRQQIMQFRESCRDLNIGEGGEGYIVNDLWCYNCGETGHWGDVSTHELTLSCVSQG